MTRLAPFGRLVSFFNKKSYLLFNQSTLNHIGSRCVCISSLRSFFMCHRNMAPPHQCEQVWASDVTTVMTYDYEIRIILLLVL